MADRDWLAERFEENRDHLRAIAQRMLGSSAEAEDAVQEAWLRLGRADAAEVENVGGWLTTVVSRVCLDALRSRRLRESPATPARSEDTPGGDPERDLMLADSVGSALLVVLDALGPAERVAYVLHDMFDLTFEEIAGIVGRSPAAARQLASRARRRIQGGSAAVEAEETRHGEIVAAFLAASREGNLDALLAVLDPDVVVRADETAVAAAAANRWGGSTELPREVHGAQAVATMMKRRAGGVQPVMIDGAPGAAWSLDGEVRAAWIFAVEGGKIVEIELVLDPPRLAGLEVTAR
jgi:RNA polymerase sigma-70 factor (ECF subfamily)